MDKSDENIQYLYDVYLDIQKTSQNNALKACRSYPTTTELARGYTVEKTSFDKFLQIAEELGDKLLEELQYISHYETFTQRFEEVLKISDSFIKKALQLTPIQTAEKTLEL